MTRKSKWLDIDFNNPRAEAVCDMSGIFCMHKDLRPQMEYAGEGLVFTGFYVHKDFLDKPNPQNMTPKVYFDPIPISNPRPPHGNDGGN